MNEIDHPTLSKKKIVKATLIGLAIGAIVLVCGIMPAEYGIDPTGAGKLFGFSRLYVPEQSAGSGAAPGNYPMIKLEDAGSGPEVARPVEADNPPPEKQYDERMDSVQVIVPAGKGIEYKVYMLKYGTMKYEWTSGGTVLFFDFHGEVAQENPPKNVFFQSHTVAYSNNMVGTFVSPFEGKHGWYFRNKTAKDVAVVIRLKGQYSM